MYLTSQGRPTDIGLQWARPAILVASNGRGGRFLLLFLHFHSCSSFFPIPFFHLFYYLLYIFSPFLWKTTKLPTKVDVSLNPNTISQMLSAARSIGYSRMYQWRVKASAKATHIFSAKNIRILYIESAKSVNEMTLNELDKLTAL